MDAPSPPFPSPLDGPPGDPCPICLGPLSSKRTSLLSCGHHFHSSCIVVWLETRESRSEQACPNCRAPCWKVDDQFLSPFGHSGQPTAQLLTAHHQPHHLRWLLRQTQSNLLRCSQQEQSAIEEGRGTEFIEDIQSERQRLITRRPMVERLLAEVRIGGGTADAPLGRPLYLQQREDPRQDQLNGPVTYAIRRAREATGLQYLVFVAHNLMQSTSSYAELAHIMNRGAGAILQYRATFLEMLGLSAGLRQLVSNLQAPLLNDQTALTLLLLLRRWERTVGPMRISFGIDREFDPSILILEIMYDVYDGGESRGVNNRTVVR